MNKINSFRALFDNDNTVLIPELWAQESLIQLENSMVSPMLVYRDYENAIASFGDTVNAWRPQEMVAKNRKAGQTVRTSNAKTTKVAVKLDQWVHTSFLIDDGEMSKSFKDLVDLHLVPAARSLGDRLDQVVTVQLYNFMDNMVGSLGSAQNKSTVIQARKLLEKNGVPKEDRNYLLGPEAEADLLDVPDFLNANTSGDGGNAMETADLGRKLNFNFYMSQNVPSISNIPAADKESAEINNGSGYAAGSTVLTVDNASADPIAGQWIVIDGDNRPRRISVSTVSGGSGDITIDSPLSSSVADDATVVIYKYAEVNEASGYDAYHSEEITIDGISETPQLGRLVTVGGASVSDTYGLVGEASATQIEFDHPLSGSLSDDDKLFLGPEGEYSFAFHKNAVALVTRPLATPRASNVDSFVAIYNDLAMRATLSYNADLMATRVTLDMLAGVKVLDKRLGVVIASN